MKKVAALSFWVAWTTVALYAANGAGTRAALVESPEEAALDTLWFDGRFLWFGYTRDRACPGDRFSSDVTLEPTTETRGRKVAVTGLRVSIRPTGKNVSCTDPKPHQIQGRIDLYDLAVEEVAALRRQGYLVDDYYRLELPPVHYFLGSPPEKSADQGKRPPDFSKVEGDAGPDKTAPPTTSGGSKMTKVTVREWQAAWECALYKNDGSRRDGFSGAGFKLDEARRDAAAECKQTNNPYCDAWSRDPKHTTCELKTVVSEVEKEYPAGQEPEIKERIPYAEWSCELWKRDGSRRDGFQGTGATEADARRQAEQGCQRTNNPYCAQWRDDPEHTACDAEIKYREN